jgi:hypothetical protein
VRYVLVGSHQQATGWCWPRRIPPAARVVVAPDRPATLTGVGADVRIVTLAEPGVEVAARLDELRAKGARG